MAKAATPAKAENAATPATDKRNCLTATGVCKQLDRAKTLRRHWDRRWEAQRKYFGPDDARFNGRKVPEGQRDRRINTDTYGVVRANALQNFLYNAVVTPTASFDLGFKGVELDSLSRPMRQWLSKERDACYAEMMDLQSNFQVAIGGVCGDMKYGNAFMATFDRPGEVGLSRHVPLSEMWVRQNRSGFIDLFMWPQEIRAGEAFKDWGTDAGPKVVELCETETGRDELVWFLHFSELNPDYNPFVRKQGAKRWRSGWVAMEDKHTVEEGWSDTSCYQEFRMLRPGGETYAVGPTDAAFEEMRMAKRVRAGTIATTEKHANGTYLVADEGIITMTTHESRGEIIVRADLLQSGKPPVQQLPVTGNPQFGMEMTKEIHAIVDLHFFRQLIELPREPRMAVDQILGLQEEAARGTAPLILPLLVGMQGIVMRYHDLRRRDGRVADPPEDVSGHKLQVAFVSPLAKAAMLSSVNAFLKGTQIAKATMDLDQRAVITADWLMGLRDTLLALGVNPELVPSREELKAKMQAMDEHTAQQAQEESDLNKTTMLKNATPAMKMLSDLFAANDTEGAPSKAAA